MGPRSLCDICTRVAIRHIQEVPSVGDLPPDNPFVHKILLKVENPRQLRQIELNSPQLQGETEEYWRRLIKNDFALLSKQKNYMPRTADRWYRVYDKYVHERGIERAEAQALLQQRFDGIEQEKQKHLSKLVEKDQQRLLPKPPRTGRNLGARLPRGKDLPSSLSFGAGSRMKMTTGQSIMKRARREAREIASITGRLSLPTGGVAKRIPVKKAPAAMVNDYRIASQPSIPLIRTTTKAATRSVPPKRKPVTHAGGTYISDSEEEEDDGDDDDDDDDDDDVLSAGGESEPGFDDLFDERPEPPVKKPKLTPALKSASPRAPEAPPRQLDPPSGSKRRGGLLSDSHRPGSQKNVRVVKTSPPIRPELRAEHNRADGAKHQLPPQQQQQRTGEANRSPPMPASRPAGGGSSPPPAYQPQLGLGQEPGLPRKRKPVDIFMPQRRRK